ncbi:MAG: response regulator [Egibacteraceae bacterium]
MTTVPLARQLHERIRLVLVDDHAIVRQGLRSILEREPDMEIVGEAADRTLALEVIGTSEPDLVLLDLRLSGTDEAEGLVLCEEVARHHRDIGIVVFTTFLDERLVTESIRRGAKGYVLKDVDVTDLVKIIRAVYRGESAFDSRSAAMVVRSMTQGEHSTGSERLTSREHEVLGLVSHGLSNREIGAALYISESTVKFHVRNLMHKLHATTRAEVVYEASKLDLL